MILLKVWSFYLRIAVKFPVLKTIVPFIPLIIAWSLVTELQVFPRAFLPGPMDVISAFGTLTYKGVLTQYLEDSVVRLAVGAAVGVALGIPLGILVGLSDRVRQWVWPILLFFQAIGDIAWLPILLVWFGFSLTTITLVIVYTVLFPIVLNTSPGALPNIMTGLRNGLGYGWRALIATEIIVGTSGIGFMMFDARRAGSVVEILLGMVVLGTLWYVVDSWVLAPIERATGKRWGLVTQ